jgi:hypothetical protein
VGLFFGSSMESSGVIFGLKAPHRGGAPKNRGIIASGYNTKRQSDILLARSLLRHGPATSLKASPPRCVRGCWPPVLNSRGPFYRVQFG